MRPNIMELRGNRARSVCARRTAAITRREAVHTGVQAGAMLFALALSFAVLAMPGHARGQEPSNAQGELIVYNSTTTSLAFESDTASLCVNKGNVFAGSNCRSYEQPATYTIKATRSDNSKTASKDVTVESGKRAEITFNDDDFQ